MKFLSRGAVITVLRDFFVKAVSSFSWSTGPCVFVVCDRGIEGLDNAVGLGWLAINHVGVEKLSQRKRGSRGSYR